jgi:hypothetical protein
MSQTLRVCVTVSVDPDRADGTVFRVGSGRLCSISGRCSGWCVGLDGVPGDRRDRSPRRPSCLGARAASATAGDRFLRLVRRARAASCLSQCAIISVASRSIGNRSGRHYDRMMSDVFVGELGIPAPGDLLGVGSGSHAIQTARGEGADRARNRGRKTRRHRNANSTLAVTPAVKLGCPPRAPRHRTEKLRLMVTSS